MRTLALDTLVLARRNAEHIRQIPEKLLDVTLQPVMFVLLFAYVFGGVIDVPGGNYHEYLMGGIMVQSLGFGMMGPGTSIATDLTEGIVDRFRSLPMRRSAYLLGHLTAEMAAVTLALVIITASGFVIGWGIDSNVVHAVGGFALLVLFAFTMVCLGTLIGIVVRSPDAVMGIAFMVVFPLTFISNAFVPADGLPSALQTFSEWNPFSAVVAGVRTLFGNPVATPSDPAWPLQHPVLSAFLWCAVILAIVVPTMVNRFEARTTG